jgi:ferredoxin-type protein NapH
MSLPVEDMVEQNNMENAECILCGTCTDVCKFKVIKYSFLNKA